MHPKTSTIVAVATATGGALSLIRLSGSDALRIVKGVFNRPILERVAQFGKLEYQEEVIDEVVVTYYKAPHSYTGEDSIEISCHGSAYISNEIVRVLVVSGAEMATAGEFTMRAFLNGKLDLSQAEAVADLIASDSRSSAQMALQQMRGGYSEKLRELSHRLLEILSLLELELDFGEEDVEFADRSKLTDLIQKLRDKVTQLADSFRLGNVLKNGIPVAIIGRPNVGKSTLLNRLLGEERALVSTKAGTTRDFIEENLNIEGVIFRFIDTAGLRSTDDELERLGIERSYQKLRSASIILQLVEVGEEIEDLKLLPEQKLIIVQNKSDLHLSQESETYSSSSVQRAGGLMLDSVDEEVYVADDNRNGDRACENHVAIGSANVTSIEEKSASENNLCNEGAPLRVSISAKYGDGIDNLKHLLIDIVGFSDYDSSKLIVSNSRHYEALVHSAEAFDRALKAVESNLSTDLISAEIRSSLSYLGEITGEITTDEILANIFANFCIGK